MTSLLSTWKRAWRPQVVVNGTLGVSVVVCITDCDGVANRLLAEPSAFVLSCRDTCSFARKLRGTVCRTCTSKLSCPRSKDEEMITVGWLGWSQHVFLTPHLECRIRPPSSNGLLVRLDAIFTVVATTIRPQPPIFVSVHGIRVSPRPFVTLLHSFACVGPRETVRKVFACDVPVISSNINTRGEAYAVCGGDQRRRRSTWGGCPGRGYRLTVLGRDGRPDTSFSLWFSVEFTRHLSFGDSNRRRNHRASLQHSICSAVLSPRRTSRWKLCWPILQESLEMH